MGSQKRERQKELHRAKIELVERTERRRRLTRGVLGIVLAVGALVGFAIVVDVVQDDDPAEVAADDPTEPTDPSVPEPELEEAVFTYGSTPCVAEGSERQIDFDDGFEDCVEPGASYVATFDTNFGEIVVDLDTDRTPGTANNFVNLSRAGYYDETAIFRTEPSLDIIQGGSPHTQDNADPGPGYRLPDEGGEYDAAGTVGPFTYEPGQLVMARSQGRDSASAQYFFTVGENASLLDSQGTYVVFGSVREGLDVLATILALDDGAGAPSEEVLVNRVTITQQ